MRQSNLAKYHSRLFKSFWESNKSWKQFHLQNLNESDHKLDEVRKSCERWNAVYEMFDIQGDPIRSFALTMPLCCDEILIQLRQSLRPSMGGWKINFPLSISNSLDKFIVLRTLFCLASTNATFDGKVPVECSILRTSFLPRYEGLWTHLRPFFELRYFYEFSFSADGRF
jgi:hypothetical protein